MAPILAGIFLIGLGIFKLKHCRSEVRLVFHSQDRSQGNDFKFSLRNPQKFLLLPGNNKCELLRDGVNVLRTIIKEN